MISLMASAVALALWQPAAHANVVLPLAVLPATAVHASAMQSLQPEAPATPATPSADRVDSAPAAQSEGQVETSPPPAPLQSEAGSERSQTSTLSETDAALVGAIEIDLWHRIRDGFRLPELDSPLVRNHEQYYAGRPDYVQRIVERGSRYLFHILEEVERRGMPSEVALLPMIESAFNPVSLSRAKASGIWQFVPSTGQHYGLKQSWSYDGRRDVFASTKAALDYIERLHRLLGEWDLALAAYNAGEGRIQRAMSANQRRGLPTDYFSLDLPIETRNYIPKLIAMRNIVRDPARFGLDINSVRNAPYFARIDNAKKMDVQVAAKLAQMSVEDFVALNPGYSKPVITAESGGLLLPVDKVDTFVENLSGYDKPLLSWQVYQAQRGEAIEQIARRFGTSPAVLREHNHVALNKRGRLAQNASLLVPAARGATKQAQPTQALASAESAPTRSAPRYHTVRRGETLYAIARTYGTTSDALAARNDLGKSPIQIGQRLVVGETQLANSSESAARPATITKPAAPKATAASYRVRSGDTLSGIAERFGVGVSDLTRWNGLSPRSVLRLGQQLRVS